MKNFDETRRRLKELGWKRRDRSAVLGAVHMELWHSPGEGKMYDYYGACKLAGLTPVKFKLLGDPHPPYKRKKEFQLKHLSTKAILTFIAEFQKRTGRWCLFYDMDAEFEGWTKFPQNLRMAKMRRLLAQDLVTGCGCGCRGDFEMTKRGYDYIGSERKRDNVAPGVNTTVDGRRVRDLWWEGATMCVQFDDDGKVAKFRGAYATSYKMEVPHAAVDPLGRVEVSEHAPSISMHATVRYEPMIEIIPITFTLVGEIKPSS
jgi:hypothetical protein